MLRAALTCLLGCAPVAPAPAQERGPEAQELFDGTSLGGWAGDGRFWRVEEGVIVGESTPATPLAEATWLVWNTGRVADFELELEARVLAGNSGLQFRSKLVRDHVVAGPQVDLDAQGLLTGSLYEQFGRGALALGGERAFHAGNATRTAEPLGTTPPLSGDPRAWKHLRLRAVGPTIDVFVDGVLTSALTDEAIAFARGSGVLALQLHEGEPMRVEFRNIRLRKLGGDERERSPDAAQWIWSGGDPGPREEAWFQTEFLLDEAPVSAALWACCDDRLEVHLNGALVAVGDGPERAVRMKFARGFKSGVNTLTLWARNESDVAGIWLELRMDHLDGRRTIVRSNETWRAWESEPRGWSGGPVLEGARPAHVFGPLGIPPWGLPESAEGGAPEASLPAEELRVAPGLRAELVYSVPRARQGSWISLAIDPAGRIVASDERGGLYRLVPIPPGSSGTVQVAERLDVEIGPVHGMCFVEHDLYAVVNAREPEVSGLYRLRDPDGDGRFDPPELLKRLDGPDVLGPYAGEHGPHAIVPARDGRSLYVIGGNQGHRPEGLTGSRLAYEPGLDRLDPPHADPNGHPVGADVAGGWICNTDLDGKDWWLVAAGLRNAFDVAVDGEGELFAFDNEMEWDLGLPWYRPARFLHVVPGADFGWRFGSAVWPSGYADSLPAILEVGGGAPTGLVFGTKTSFPERWKKALFAGDWAFGRVLALELEEQGSTYSGSVTTLLEGRPLAVVDLAVGVEGALYVLTGGRGTQSTLYRVTAQDDDPGAEMSGKTGTSASSSLLGSLQRLARIALCVPGVTMDIGDDVVADVWLNLSHPDAFMRHAARSVLERSRLEAWLASYLAAEDPLAMAEASIALAHAGKSEHAALVFSRLEGLDLAAIDAVARRAALRAAVLAIARLARPTATERELLLAWLEPAFPTQDPESDALLVELLVDLESSRVARATVQLLDATADTTQALRLAWLLRRLKAGWSVDDRRAYFRFLNGRAAKLGGGASFDGYMGVLRTDAIATLTEEEKEALGPVLETPSPADAAAGTTRPFVRVYRVRDLLPALPRLAEPRDLARGKRLFAETSCLSCHRMDGAGGSRAPDLSSAGARFSARDLVETILNPSQTITDQYRDTEIWTKDERVYVGSVQSEDAETLTLAIPEPSPERLVIRKDEIALRRPAPLSRMPEGLLDTLELEEALDLLAYLIASEEQRAAITAK